MKNYKVNPDGGIWSLFKCKYLKTRIRSDGYVYCVLTINDKLETKYIHRLVAEAFIPNPKNKPQVNHKNGIKHDNRVQNLEWVTAAENMKHAYKIGLQKKQIGEKNTMARLDEHQVRSIMMLLERGENRKKICERFDISRSHLYQIKNKTRWGHLWV